MTMARRGSWVLGCLLSFTAGVWLTWVTSRDVDLQHKSYTRSYLTVDRQRLEVNHYLGEDLYEKVRVLCIVATYEHNHRLKADHVAATWGKRCNKLIFMSNVPDDRLPVLHYNVSGEKQTLTRRHFRAFQDVYTRHFRDFDWFLKADDDSYVILENLRYFLSGQNSSDPVYFGHVFKPFVRQGYASGGAGYVLSQEAMQRFGEHSQDCTFQETGLDDVIFGKCMQTLNVTLGDSRDALGRTRFHGFDLGTFLQGTYPESYDKYDKYGAKKGARWMSDYAISFHYIPPGKLYELDYLIYNLHPYGMCIHTRDLNSH